MACCSSKASTAPAPPAKGCCSSAKSSDAKSLTDDTTAQLPTEVKGASIIEPSKPKGGCCKKSKPEEARAEVKVASSCCASKPKPVIEPSQDIKTCTKLVCSACPPPSVPSSCSRVCCSPASRPAVSKIVPKTGCCGPKKEVAKSSCCATVEIKDEEEDDDDSLCPCCVKLLVSKPELLGMSLDDSSRLGLLPSALPSIPRPAPVSMKTSLDGFARRIRRCCRLLESTCMGKECCFVSPRPSARLSQPRVSTCQQVDKEDPRAEDVKPVADSRFGVEPLTLEISGMDCIDCLLKVTKALLRLPSVNPLELDYLSGLATLAYDPEVINPDAISRFVARATGFGVKAVGKQTTRSASDLALPVRFGQAPPEAILERYNGRARAEAGGFVELSFPVQGDKARQPRDVMVDLAPYNPELVPIARVEQAEDRVAQDLRRIAYRTLAACTLSIPVLVLAWAPLSEEHATTYGIVSTVLTTLILIIGFPIISSSVRSIVYLHQADMGVLVAVSTLTAWLFSLFAFAFQAAGKPFTQEPFFETTALLISLIYVGRLVQAKSRRSASSAVRALQDLQMPEVTVVEKSEKDTVEKTMDARLLHYGDILRIRADTRIPTDGILVSGSGEVDESSTTGESLPAPKSVGSPVSAGTMNLNGSFDIQVTRLIHENSLAQVAGLVRQAQSSKSPIQNIADRFSAFILPCAAVTAAISFVAWILINRYVRDRSTSSSAVSALTYALSVLIVSCPCAIGLAIPLVVSSTMRAGLREGILFRSSDALQAASSIDVVAFDKTGTLSTSTFSLARSEVIVDGVEGLIASLTAASGHPVSKAVLAHLTSTTFADEKRSLSQLNIVSLPGQGVKGTLGGYPLLGGHPRFTGCADSPVVKGLTDLGLTLFTVTIGGELVAAYGLADTPRPESAGLIEELKMGGKRVVILSGDNAGAVERFARSVEVPSEDVFAGCSPADKAAFIARLQSEARRVAFVGDGTNDGPALAQADVSFSIGSGSDVAVAASGVVVIGSNLRRSITSAFKLATHARQHMLLSLGWCGVYFVFATLAASGAFVRFRIEPQWAGLGELVSVLPVVAVGLGLDLRWRGQKRWSDLMHWSFIVIAAGPEISYKQ